MEQDELLIIVKQIDRIMSSDNDQIKESFKELLILSALIERTPKDAGMFENMLRQHDDLQTRVERLEINHTSYHHGIYNSGPAWIGGAPT